MNKLGQHTKTQLQMVETFLRSFSFKVWRKYHKLRDVCLTFFSISPVQSYEDKGINHQLINLISTSKAFRAWKYIYYFRTMVLNNYMSPLFKFVKRHMPLWMKAKLKKVIFVLQFSPHTAIGLLMKEWDRWKEDRPDHSIDIINFSVISYDYRFQRPQHLASELSKNGHRVFYIENEFNFTLSPKHSSFTIQKRGKNLYTVKLSSPRDYFIYKDTPSVNAKKVIIASLKKLLREALIVNPVAKIDHPFWESIAAELGMPIVYDVMDLHEGFKETGKTIAEKENSLIAKSQLVLVSSDYIRQKIEKKRINDIVTLKNAGEFNHFIRAANGSLPLPSDLRKDQKKIIGYYGAIAEWLDVGIIERMARDFPESLIVMIGRSHNLNLDRITKRYKNILMLGEKPYSILPQYLKLFDVCIIPFLLTDLIKATNPVKIYEYFASGKPVVTTKIPELNEHNGLVYFASNPAIFSKMVARAMKEKPGMLNKQRQQVAKLNTWEERGKTLEKELHRILFPKISIVSVVYNNPIHTKKTIDSILYRSKYPNFELIVVDNNSNYETKKVLSKYKRNEKVRIISNEKNFGFAKGNNIGMKSARGKYIVLINNDVIVTPGWLSRLLFHIRENNVGLVGPVTNNIGNEAKINIAYDQDNVEDLENQACNYTYSHWNDIIELENVAAFCWMMSRDIYIRIGGFDERFGKGLFEDDDYCMQVKKEGYKVICADDVFIHHFGGATTKWDTPEYRKLLEVNKKKFEEKWSVRWKPHKYRKGVI